jgi:hypothetical protein
MTIHCNVPFLCLYLCVDSGRPLNSSQARVTAVTEATGSCTLETSPMLQNNANFLSYYIVYLFESENLQLFFSPKQGVIWSFYTRFVEIKIPKVIPVYFRQS